jgi:hypothetical protein
VTSRPVSEVVAARARSAAEKVARLPGMRHPASLVALTDEEILDFHGVHITGGHGSMVDFGDNGGRPAPRRLWSG